MGVALTFIKQQRALIGGMPAWSIGAGEAMCQTGRVEHVFCSDHLSNRWEDMSGAV